VQCVNCSGGELIALAPSAPRAVPGWPLTPEALLEREEQILRDVLTYGISVMDEHGNRIAPESFLA
jgi:hypothetical protein